MFATATPQVGNEGATGMLSSTRYEYRNELLVALQGTLTAAQKKIAAQRLQEERVIVRRYVRYQWLF